MVVSGTVLSVPVYLVYDVRQGWDQKKYIFSLGGISPTEGELSIGYVSIGGRLVGDAE